MDNTNIQEIIDRAKFVPEGYKKTSLGNIPNEWDIKKLSDFLDYIQPTSYLNDDIVDLEDEINTIPVLTAGKSFILGYTVDDDKTFSNIPIILFDDFTTENKYVDFPFKVRSSAAKILIAKNDLFNFKFIYEAMQVINFVSTDHKRYWISEYQNLKLPIPPQHEQQKIAEILSTWDDAIKNCKATINKLKDRNKGLAQQLLTGKKRLKGFSEKWTNTQLGKISKRVTAKNEELNDTVVTISAQRGFVLQEDFFNKRVASDTLSGYYLLKKGQFAYNKSYSNGYPMGAFKRLNNFEKAVVTTLYICFELLENVNSDYMVHFFENGFMTNNLMKVAKEGGRAHGLLNIGLDDFMNLELKIPSFKEQTAVAHVLETADQELKSYETKLEALQLQKKGLMQQLLTGKIRVNVK